MFVWMSSHCNPPKPWGFLCTFGAIGRPSTKQCACLSFQKFWTHGAKVIEFKTIFVFGNQSNLFKSLFFHFNSKVKLILTWIVLGWATLQEEVYHIRNNGTRPISISWKSQKVNSQSMTVITIRSVNLVV